MPAVTSTAKPEDKPLEERYAEHFEKVRENERKLLAARAIRAAREAPKR